MKKKRQVNTVLLIEPVIRIRSGLEVTLKQSGYHVSAERDAAGLSQIESLYPDVLVISCDVASKGMDSFDICENIARSGAVPAIIMSSAQPTKQMVIKAVRAGAMDFLVTPAMGLQLAHRIERVFGKTEDAEARGKFPVIDFGDKELTHAQKIKIIIKEAATVRAMPHAVTRILRITSSDEAGARDITKAAESDPTIAAMLLKRANSSYYSGGKQVTDLQTAIVRLGFKECRDLVVGLTVFNLFSRSEQSFGFNRIWYWLHSVSCAVLANLLASRVAFEGKADSFTAGLLHDIGKILLDDFLNKPYREVIRKTHTEKIRLIIAEEQVLEGSHVGVGSQVAENWRFAPSICQAISEHHNSEIPHTTQRPSLVAAVYLANQMSKAMLVGSGGDFILDDVPDHFCAMFNFEGIVQDRFLEQFYNGLQEFCSFLQIKDKEIEQAIDRRSGSGQAVMITQEGFNSWMMSLFLVNQGFCVQTTPEPQSLQQLDEAPRLCLVLAQDLDFARTAIEQIEAADNEPVPTVCVLPGDVAPDGLRKTRKWLRTAKRPVDTFDLLCKVRDLLPNLNEPQSASQVQGATARQT